ncbi:MAG TPA: four helix bundle protein, partial [Tepidisphaeraceae bacterium]|nr:four helix bundle protein [Tepidisphaeraceae bacterium]
MLHQRGRGGWKHFREIVAWQYARELKLSVDQFLERPAIKQKYRLSDQLSDAARSGPSNIAEGFGKFGNKEFARFTRIAKGSEVEVLNHLIDLRGSVRNFVCEAGLISTAGGP